MDTRYREGFDTGVDKYTFGLHHISGSELLVQKFKLLKSRFVKPLLPVAVLTTLSFIGFGNKAYAETIDNSSFFDRGKDMFSGFMGNTVSNVLPAPVTEVFNWFGEFIKIAKEIPHNITRMSAELLAWVYELVADLILKTPLLLFDNDWFEQMLRLFSGASVGCVLVLTIIEGIKLMLTGFKNKNIRPMQFKQIIIRWSLVAGATSVFPLLFKSFFKGLNFLSDKLIDMNVGIMKVNSLTETFSTVDTLVLLAFDVMLVSTIIPLLMINGRRFFDLLVLGVISPIALSCWVFDSKRHFFNQWYSSIKHLSFVQVYHSFFLLIIGLFIFGVPFPVTFSGTVIKLLVVIGGLYRMQSPPKLISKHLDNGKDIRDITTNPLKEISKGLVKNFTLSKNVVTSPLRLLKKIKK